MYNEKVKDIVLQIDELNNQLKQLQEDCGHTKVVYKYKSNTGNYDPSCDSYWVDVKCLDCGESMSFDSEEEDYSLNGVIGSEMKITPEEQAVLRKFDYPV